MAVWIEGEGGGVEWNWTKISLFLVNFTLLSSTPPPSPLNPNGRLERTMLFYTFWVKLFMMKSINILLDTLSAWEINQRRSVVRSQFTTTRGFSVPKIPLILHQNLSFATTRQWRMGAPFSIPWKKKTLGRPVERRLGECPKFEPCARGDAMV